MVWYSCSSASSAVKFLLEIISKISEVSLKAESVSFSSSFRESMICVELSLRTRERWKLSLLVIVVVYTYIEILYMNRDISICGKIRCKLSFEGPQNQKSTSSEMQYKNGLLAAMVINSACLDNRIPRFGSIMSKTVSNASVSMSNYNSYKMGGVRMREILGGGGGGIDRPLI